MGAECPFNTFWRYGAVKLCTEEAIDMNMGTDTESRSNNIPRVHTVDNVSLNVMGESDYHKRVSDLDKLYVWRSYFSKHNMMFRID
jgi:hypothetical protein